MTDTTADTPTPTGSPIMTETPVVESSAPGRDREANSVVFDIDDLDVYYGDFRAVHGVSLDIRENEITAFIGPSGCGKSTVLRCLNRMNDLIPEARIDGSIKYHGVDLYDRKVDPVEVRRRIGMVFQKANPFPKSIYENIAFGTRISGDRWRSGRARSRARPSTAHRGWWRGRARCRAAAADHPTCRGPTP